MVVSHGIKLNIIKEANLGSRSTKKMLIYLFFAEKNHLAGKIDMHKML